jgi:hypothetical protein
MQPAHEKIGVIDSQWIVHQTVPSLGNQVYPIVVPIGAILCGIKLTSFLFQQGKSEIGKALWEGVIYKSVVIYY